MHHHTLDPADTVLLVVDVQERFRPAIDGFDAMLAGCLRLVRTFRLLGRAVIVTEQYPKGLGRTVAELRSALEERVEPAEKGGPAGPGAPLEKTIFSACGAPGIDAWIPLDGGPGRKRTVLVCGIETHVCVQQSVHDLLDAAHAVHVAVDAVGSRRKGDREVALRRMERAGAILTTAEMAAFELMRDARHPQFKAVQALFK